jgi:hypothetical protein
LAVVSEDAEREEAAAGSGSSDPDSNSGSIDTAVFVEAVPAAAAVSPFAAAGVVQQGHTQAPNTGVFNSLLYSSGTAAAAAPDATTAAETTADTAGKADQSMPAAASKFKRPPKKAISFTHGSSKDAATSASTSASRQPRASIDIGAAAARRVSRMSMDLSGPHRQQQQQQQNLLHFSLAAEAARATGTCALGRISLPGRSRAVMEASSLYTHLILPEPTASVPGNRAGGSQRLLAVTADGSLLPGGMVNASFTGMGRAQSENTPLVFDEHPGVIHEGSSEGNAVDSGGSWSWGGCGDNNIQMGGQLSSSVGSFALAGKDADATVLQLPMGSAAAAAGNEDGNTNSALSNGGFGFGGDIVPIVQGQLQQLAAAVINKRVSIDLQGSSSARRRSFGSFTFSRQPSATSAGFTSDMTGWTVAESVLGSNTAAENGCTEMFNTQAAVIPTLPENIYEHTIAAVPNFGARSAPKASWMFFIVNAVLLSALFGASFVEVYCG